MYYGARDDRHLWAAIGVDGGLDEGFAVGRRDDVVDVDVVVELIDLYAVRPGVEFGLSSDERSDVKWPVGL